MSKLFSLKEWLTPDDAAKHLSIVFGEDVTKADVLRLALDLRLRLSVHFVNHATARRGKVAQYSESELRAAIASGNLPQDLRWDKGPLGSRVFFHLPPDKADPPGLMLMSIYLGDDRYLTLEKSVTTLTGVWDLPMIGAERLDIEHEYQQLTGGPAVTLNTLDGAFVAGRDGTICQLQNHWEDNEWQPGSSAAFEKLKQRIAEYPIEGAEAEALLNRHKEDRKAFLKEQRARPKHENFYPAGGLPEDGVLVVRTEALSDFEKSVNAVPLPTTNDYVSEKLATLNQAAEYFWRNADPGARETHPENAKVKNWLLQRGFAETLADKAATIIRPAWAPTGRKPEE